MSTDTSKPGRWLLSLRARITLWMVVIYLVVQLSLVVVLQLYQRRSVNEFYDDRLLIRHALAGQDLRPQLATITDTELLALADHYRRLLSQPQVVVAVYDERGEPVASSHPPAVRLSAPLWAQVAASTESSVVQAPTISRLFADPDSARVAAGWVRMDDGRRFILVFAWTDRFADEMQRRLSGAVYITIPIGLMALLVSAYAISGIAIRPIRAAKAMAKGLELESLGQSVLAPRGPVVAEVAELQRDLEHTRQRLEHAFAAQERFMSNVSHEFKTPISAMMTEAQALRLRGLPSDMHRFIDSAIEELERLGRMVDGFLLLTRVRHGKATIPDQQHCTVADIVVASYESCAMIAAQAGVKITVRMPEDAASEVTVLGSCDLLRTVLDNIVRNAIRFTPKGDVIELVARVENDQLLIEVRDSGPGIPSELIPRIFDRFSQSSDEQRRGRGHGLGLEIAMGITELHGGTIKVRNRPEGGCEFSVRLPLSRQAPPSPSVHHGVGSEPPPNGA